MWGIAVIKASVGESRGPWVGTLRHIIDLSERERFSSRTLEAWGQFSRSVWMMITVGIGQDKQTKIEKGAHLSTQTQTVQTESEMKVSELWKVLG
jgi:hypothetical protein